MPRYVALFRGINVGKAKRIAMADLRSLLADLGFTEIQTLLNSGNAVFTGPREAPDRLAARLRTTVAKKLGVDALVIIKSARDVAGIVSGHVLDKLATDHSRLLVAMTNDGRALAALEPLAKSEWGAEKVHVGKHAAYVWCANGILESKAVVALLKNLNGTGTTRNWATVLKIHALLIIGKPA
jgi:uncharacterized protein (DUF1697 family)